MDEVAGLADVGPGGAGLCLEADVGLKRSWSCKHDSVHCNTTALRPCVINLTN